MTCLAGAYILEENAEMIRNSRPAWAMRSYLKTTATKEGGIANILIQICYSAEEGKS